MFQICFLMAGDEIDDTSPEPGWRVQGLGAAVLQICQPLRASVFVHLPGVGFPDNSGEEAGRPDNFVTGELIHFQFKVLRKQFAQYYRLPK